MTLATDQKEGEGGLSATSRAMLALRQEVFDLWEASVRDDIDEAEGVSGPILINTLPAFYDNIAEALTLDYPRDHGASNTTSMSAHGGERARMTPFRADQIILEYQLFRDAIGTISRRNGLQFSTEEWRVVEVSIDTAVRDAIREFSVIQERMRERLAATLSHDMRNPLSLILTATQLITGSQDLDTAHRVAAKIEVGAQRMQLMLAELVDALTFERSTKLPLALSQFDMRSLLDAVAQQFNVGGDERIEVHAASIIGYWCRSSLHRALDNLITNAIKYGDGGRIRIKADSQGGRLIMSVHNHGEPIAEEQRERIFEYLRREGEGSMAEGWGIGLPYVRSVAEAHGGSVAVDSSAATGTTFIIDIPVDCQPYASAAAR
ncbi:HAMP domain-containing histidine kinase [Duganella sp. sic0402]|uniref:sensor histidine kinase n=1 Tax=Duganella sp. sic0402 TaxID=2854786 RepID=UPI001C48F17A|nr:HAMP domain-containing sensor histidine kinase [Duganella sp. sic0402]MBV7534156.1 HAMP domain-containing histidine kinase [Duganella sp. sic0402]